MTFVKRQKAPAWSRLEQLKRESTGQLLLKCARLLDEKAVALVRRGGAPPLRPAHTRLLPHIDQDGTRLTELARRLGITKQAVGQLVDEMVEMGTLAIEPDPTDGRARRVRFTSQGMEAIAHGLGVLGEIEQELAARVGKRRMKDLHATLSLLLEALTDLDDPRAAPPRGSR
jgi:DNA-binding MarR family transcriptional regulator